MAFAVLKLPAQRSQKWRRYVPKPAAPTLAAGPVRAQAADPQTITITGKSRGNTAALACVGDVPLSAAPF